MLSKKLVALVLIDVRSAYNVGSIFRSADGLGASEVWLCGISPYPEIKNDRRSPHIRAQVTHKIHKAALGAENYVTYHWVKKAETALVTLKAAGYQLYALEQPQSSTRLWDFKPHFPCALIVGNERTGLDKKVLDTADTAISVPMVGQKESLNVAVAAAIGLAWLKNG